MGDAARAARYARHYAGEVGRRRRRLDVVVGGGGIAVAETVTITAYGGRGGREGKKTGAEEDADGEDGAADGVVHRCGGLESFFLLGGSACATKAGEGDG